MALMPERLREPVFCMKPRWVRLVPTSEGNGDARERAVRGRNTLALHAAANLLATQRPVMTPRHLTPGDDPASPELQNRPGVIAPL
jgi:hypothetical protein